MTSGAAVIPGLMQDVPLGILHLFDRAEKYFGHKTIVTATGTGLERTTYAQLAERTRRLEQFLINSVFKAMVVSRRLHGTLLVTSSCTLPRRAPDAYCTL